MADAEAGAADGETPWTGRAHERFIRELGFNEFELRNIVAGHVPVDAVVLDVGCGNGLMRAHVTGGHVGLDWEATLEPDIVSDSADIPLDDGEVDVALAKNHLQHHADPEAVVAEMLRVASDRVIAFERVWADDRIPTQVVTNEPVRRRRFNRDDLASLLGVDGPVELANAPSLMGLYVREV